MDQATLKKQAAAAALAYVEPGMKLGLGSGSTAAAFVDALAERVADGLRIIGVPTSETTRKQAERLGIALTTLNDEPFLDLTIDGADEFDARGRLIKGGGGAHLREKIVAMSSERLIIVADESKFVDTLGAFPLPIEVVQFGYKATWAMIDAIAGEFDAPGCVSQRLTANGEPFVTDSGNFILDCAFARIERPEALAEALQIIPGMVEHGLFIGLADEIIIAGADGIRILQPVEDDVEEVDNDES